MTVTAVPTIPKKGCRKDPAQESALSEKISSNLPLAHANWSLSGEKHKRRNQNLSFNSKRKKSAGTGCSEKRNLCSARCGHTRVLTFLCIPALLSY